MGPKYAKRQKVRIIAVKNQQLKPKYPQLEKHVSESGTQLKTSLKVLLLLAK